MAETTKRRTGTLMRGLFKILLAEPDGLQAQTALKRLAEQVPPTEFESATYADRPTVRRYERIIRFSTLGPVKAGWMVKHQGIWTVTEDGKKAYKDFSDPEAFVREANRLYRQWRSTRPDPEVELEEIIEPEIEVVAVNVTLEEAEESAWTEIEARLGSIPPYDFQELVAGLLIGMGYHVAWKAPAGPDKGIDIIAFGDPFGVNGPRLKVQVKRQIDKVTAQGLRSFLALLNEGDIGLFVCTGGFTKEAELEARQQEKRRLTLLDAQALFKLWVEHYAQIPEEKRSLLAVRPVFYLISNG